MILYTICSDLKLELLRKIETKIGIWDYQFLHGVSNDLVLLQESGDHLLRLLSEHNYQKTNAMCVSQCKRLFHGKAEFLQTYSCLRVGPKTRSITRKHPQKIYV